MASILSVVFLSVFFTLHCQGCFYNMMHDPMPISQDDPPEDFGQPLYLTPIIDSGDLERARRTSKVGHLPHVGSHINSYSGYLTVNKELGSHMFFWFFPATHAKVLSDLYNRQMGPYTLFTVFAAYTRSSAVNVFDVFDLLVTARDDTFILSFQDNDHGAPIVVWLQGGPGLSSLIGVFAEHGPFFYDSKKEKLVQRNFSWVDTFNVLYIDNPVGTGFSYTEKDEGYARNETQIGDDLYEALNQFFEIFHHYKSNNIYLAGEGYACKYIASLAQKLHSEDGGPHELDLKGIAVGNGMCDPMMVTNQTDFLYQTGLIDHKHVENFINHSEKFDSMIGRKHYDGAVEELSRMFHDMPSKTSYFRHITGMENLYDIRYSHIPRQLYSFTKYLSVAQVRKALHVGMLPFNSHKTVCKYLTDDLMLSVKSKLETLLNNNYKVMFYHGHLDILSPYTQSVSFLKSLNWRRTNEKHKRIIWTYHQGNETQKLLGGYVHHVGDFLEVMVWKAGHFVPLTAPKAAHDMACRFIWGKSFH